MSSLINSRPQRKTVAIATQVTANAYASVDPGSKRHRTQNGRKTPTPPPTIVGLGSVGTRRKEFQVQKLLKPTSKVLILDCISGP